MVLVLDEHLGAEQLVEGGVAEERRRPQVGRDPAAGLEHVGERRLLPLRHARERIGRRGLPEAPRYRGTSVMSAPTVPSCSSPPGTRRRTCPDVLDELASELPDVDVLVVDDGSTDATAAVAREHGAEVLSFGENRGLQAGIAAGYEYALTTTGTRVCGRVDADGQHPAAELRAAARPVRSGVCDVAVGSRFAGGRRPRPYRYRLDGARRFGTPIMRRAMGVVLRRPFLDADERHVRRERGGDCRSCRGPTRAARPRWRRCCGCTTPACGSTRCPCTCASAQAASPSCAARRPSCSC